MPPASPVSPAPLDPNGGWRTFLWLWSSQALSVLGSGLSGFAFNIYLTQTRFPLESQKPELAAALSLTALGWALAAIVGAPLAGALADRLDRRRMMLTCDLLNALLSAGAVALVLSSSPPIWLFVLFTAALGLVGTFHGSAFDTSYSSLVSRERLPRANGMMQTLWSLSGLLSPALAALLIGLPALARSGNGPNWLAGLQDGVPLAFALDGLSFAVAALVVWRLRIPSPVRVDLAEGAANKPSLWADMRVGWTFILARRPLLHLLLTFASVNLLTSGVGVLHPLLVKFTLAPDLAARGLTVETGLATLWTAMSAGGLAGGLLISAWGGLKWRRVLGVLVPMVLAGAAQALSGIAGTVVFTAAAIAFFGIMTPIMNAHSQSIWQAQVPSELQGRVFSVRRLIAQFTVPVGTAISGVLAARYAPGSVLLWAGLAMTAVSALQLLNPVMRRVEDPLGASGSAVRV
ncbi:MFS transporter [Deinococcus puniceus]|uniref:MFS transporter n=1 Tax=Deinococcus puniceus TaxID=1182568 RepID=A0A172TBS1_9DEIO|nr:MFS transporter [Deinococcus puniceus]ANE44479.1 MFS transporter [Deinococcus puniceus]